MDIESGVKERRPFKVTLTVFEDHEYEVEARSSEEAISMAEQYFSEGEEGTVTSSNVDISDAWPIDENGDEELEEVA